MNARMRARSLNVRGNAALIAAATTSVFVATAMVAGGWSSTHAWLVVALAAFSVTALACFWRAGKLTDKPGLGGDSPPVTHPLTPSSQTPVEVRK